MMTLLFMQMTLLTLVLQLLVPYMIQFMMMMCVSTWYCLLLLLVHTISLLMWLVYVTCLCCQGCSVYTTCLTPVFSFGSPCGVRGTFCAELRILHMYIDLATHPKRTPQLGSAAIDLRAPDIAYF